MHFPTIKKKKDNHVHGLEKEPLSGVWAANRGLLTGLKVGHDCVLSSGKEEETSRVLCELETILLGGFKTAESCEGRELKNLA